MFCKNCKEDKSIMCYSVKDRNSLDYTSLCSKCELVGRIPENKKCSQCKEIKDSNEFGFDRTKKNGLRTYCKACCEYNRQSLVSEKINTPDVYTENKHYRNKLENNLRRFKRQGIVMTMDEYLSLLKNSSNKCDICDNSLVGKQANLDHDHGTSKVRGILCSNCNILLGQAKDSIIVLSKSIKYLQKHTIPKTIYLANFILE